MKVSGCTFLRNAQSLGYPFIQSIKSILPIVDEFVIAVGHGNDKTMEILQSLNEPKLRIIETSWNENMISKGYVYGQQKMIAQYSCSGDWIFYLEADEVVHEDDLQVIKSKMEMYLHDDDVEVLVFDYIHFYGNTNTYLWSPGWYRRAPRIIKASVRSYAPDGLFWLILRDSNKVGKYPKAVLCEATIYHYGWVRSESQMSMKKNQTEKYWNTKNKAADYSQMDSTILKQYLESHPIVMKDYLSITKELFEVDPCYKPTRKQLKHRMMLKLEKLFGLELSRKHYKLVK